METQGSTQLELLGDSCAQTPVPDSGIKKKKKKKFDFLTVDVCSNKSFSNFLAGASNLAALKIAKRIIDKPGMDFPLVFFVGDTGVGKTHLLHAIYKELEGKKNIYISTAKAFLDYFQIKCKNHGYAKFLIDFVDNVDVLLLDDIEDIFISPDFQNDFCHIYNHFNSRKKQIILSGHFSPENLTGVFPKFSSRLNGGLVQEIKSMDPKLGREFLNQKAEDEKIILNDKKIDYIIKNSKNDGRSIRAALLKVKAQEITKVEAPTLKPQSLAHDIVNRVAQMYKINTPDLYSNSRKKQYILGRHVAMFLLSKGMEMSLFKIGQLFSRDHSSILYAVTRVEAKMKEDKNFSEDLSTACERVKSKKLPWPDPASYN